MGQRTYREVGIIAREILGLKGQSTKQDVDGEVRKESESESVADAPPLQPEPEFEQGSESDMPDVSVFMDPPSFADVQLLDTNFDFCGLFDMNVPSMAAV